MRKTRLTVISGLVILLLLHIPDTAAHPPDSVSSDHQKAFTVGLALSGGGAAGMAHIGVLKVFEEEGIPVDVVGGTSMGAIVGALYAMGYTPEQMEMVVRTTDWRYLLEEPTLRKHLPMEEKKYDGVFNLSFPFEGRKIKLPTGLVSGNFIFQLLAHLTWPAHNIENFSELPRPFFCIATDLETGEQVILDRGFLPMALRASMSIPSIFDPVFLDGKYLADGGLVNNLPVKETREMGADYVIAINSSSDLKPVSELTSLPDILTQTITIGMRVSMMQQAEKADFYIQPELTRFSTLGFSDIEEIILAGEIAARKRVYEIRSLADSLNKLRGRDSEPASLVSDISESINIRTIKLEGLETIPADHIYSKLQLQEHTTIHKDELEDGLLRLYGMNRFYQVSYKLDWYNQQADLILYFEEETANLLQAGLFHNSELGPSINFNVSFRNLIYPASTGRVNLRLGHEAMLEGEYFNYIGLEPRLSFHGAVGFRERQIDIYENKTHRSANLRTDIFYAEGMFGPLFASVFRAGAGYRIERFNLTEKYGDLNVPDRWNTLHFFISEVEFDSRNRSSLTTNGTHLYLRANLSPEFVSGNNRTFGTIFGSTTSYFPVSPDLTFIQQFRGGHSFGDHIPLHYLFYSGGHERFWGYRKDAMAGNNYITARMAIQYQFYNNFYLTPGINVGKMYEKFDFEIFDKTPDWGWGLVFGWNTIFGPLEAVFMGSDDHAFLFEFQLGINF